MKRPGVLLLPVALVLWLAAAGCDVGPAPPAGASTPAATVAGTHTAQQATDVQPLEKILVKGPDFTNIRSDSMTLLVDTSIPVVCAAAYGTTTGYGKLATDSDMAGGPHSNHHPVL